MHDDHGVDSGPGISSGVRSSGPGLSGALGGLGRETDGGVSDGSGSTTGGASTIDRNFNLLEKWNVSLFPKDKHTPFNLQWQERPSWPNGWVRSKSGFRIDASTFPDKGYFGDFDFQSSETKMRIMRGLLDVDPDKFGQPKPSDRDILAEALWELNKDKKKSDGVGYDPFRSEVLSGLLNDQLGPDPEDCPVCERLEQPEAALKIDWSHVGVVIEKLRMQRAAEYRAEQQRKKDEARLARVILDPATRPPFAEYARPGPPYDLPSALGTLHLAPYLPKRRQKGVGGIGFGLAGSMPIRLKASSAGSVSLLYVEDRSMNYAWASCYGVGAAYGTGIIGGIQITEMWNVDNVCDIERWDFSPSWGGGYARGGALSGDIGQSGYNIIIGAGSGGWGGSANAMAGCKLLWTKYRCNPYPKRNDYYIDRILNFNYDY